MNDEIRLPTYIAEMIEYENLAIGFIEEMDEELFLRDIKTQLAVTQCLEIVGETAGNIIKRHPDFVSKNQDVPRKK